MLVRGLNMTQRAKSETLEMVVFDLSVVDVNIFCWQDRTFLLLPKIDRIMIYLSVLNVRKKLVRSYWSGQSLVLQLLGQI